MNDDFEQNAPAEETDVLSLLKKMQQQLVFIEKKLDNLMHQSGDRPSYNRDHRGGERRFPKPFRPFDPNRRPDEGRRDSGPRDRGFGHGGGGGGRHFDRPGREHRGGFGGGHRKKSFSSRGRDRD